MLTISWQYAHIHRHQSQHYASQRDERDLVTKWLIQKATQRWAQHQSKPWKNLKAALKHEKASRNEVSMLKKYNVAIQSKPCVWGAVQHIQGSEKQDNALPGQELVVTFTGWDSKKNSTVMCLIAMTSFTSLQGITCTGSCTAFTTLVSPNRYQSWCKANAPVAESIHRTPQAEGITSPACHYTPVWGKGSKITYSDGSLSHGMKYMCKVKVFSP